MIKEFLTAYFGIVCLILGILSFGSLFSDSREENQIMGLVFGILMLVIGAKLLNFI